MYSKHYNFEIGFTQRWEQFLYRSEFNNAIPREVRWQANKGSGRWRTGAGRDRDPGRKEGDLANFPRSPLSSPHCVTFLVRGIRAAQFPGSVRYFYLNLIHSHSCIELWLTYLSLQGIRLRESETHPSDERELGGSNPLREKLQYRVTPSRGDALSPCPFIFRHIWR